MQLKLWTSIVLMVLVDQYSKYLFFSSMQLSCNMGISFGILGQLSSWSLTVLLISLLGVFIYILRELIAQYPVSLGLFLGGGVSNIIDRVMLGCVRDWLPIPFTQILNNLADWAIFAGIALLWIASLSKQRSTTEG